MRRLILIFSIIIIAVSSCKKDDFTILSGNPSNLAVYSGYAYVAVGDDGMEIYEISTGAVVAQISPGGELGSIDDVNIADGILFALDARPPKKNRGVLASYSLANPLNPSLVTQGCEVPAGPYCGVSAAAGEIIVSGGTTEMALLEYDAEGKITAVKQLERDRGYPEATISQDGGAAIISTHYEGGDFVDGQEYGLITVSTQSNDFIDRVGIPGAGGTAGGGTPASWPVRVKQSGSHVFCAHGGGITAIELTADYQLEIKSTLALSVAGVDVAVDGNIAYVIGSSPSPTLILVDISDVTNMTIIEERDITNEGAFLTGIELWDNKILIAANQAGLLILDK